MAADGLPVLHSMVRMMWRTSLRSQGGLNARVFHPRFGFPLAHTGSGWGLRREGLKRFAAPLPATWSPRRGMTCCARAVQ